MNYFLRMLPAILTVLLGAGLLATIFFTLLDWQWVAFLSGILFSAVLALASRSSNAEWRIARRNAQIARFKESLAQETAARKRAEEALGVSEENLRLFSDTMPCMLTYVDAGQRFRFHNRNYRLWLGLSAEQIDGQHISDVLGPGVYAEIEEKIRTVLAGEAVNYERSQTMASGAVNRLRVTYLPHCDKLGKVIGFFGLLNDITERDRLSVSVSPRAQEEDPAENEPGGRPLVVTAADGQTLYLNSMTEQLTGWSDPAARLRQAIDGDEFRLYYQKIISLANDDPAQPCSEILIRLQEEENNLTPPGAFISVAEQFNLTTKLDCWVVRNVIKWHRHNRRNTPAWHGALYCINLFAATVGNTGFSEYVRKLVTESGVPPQVLCFEVDESEAVERLAAAARFITDLRRIGCRIALVGFGGGKVSFDTLKHLQVDFLKIDGSIVRGVEDDPVNIAKIKAISRVSKVIGVRTIAQFVESDATLAKLAETGVDFAQGFGIGKPRPLANLPRPRNLTSAPGSDSKVAAHV